MKRLLTVFGLVLLVVVVLVGGLALRAAALSSRQPLADPAPDVDTARVQQAATRLSELVALRTVSDQDRSRVDPAPFLALHAWLAGTYPAAHAAMQRELVGDLSLLYTLPGTDPSLAPVLLLAHMDVVPVEPGTEGRWSHPPFSGAIAEGFVWGRGTIDMKPVIVGIFEALEGLAQQGWRPRRTLLIGLGHDEEVGGMAGQQQIHDLLAARDVHPAWVLDEGLVITDGIVPGLPVPAALIGVAEKGYLSVELAVEGQGGHSSMPPPHSAAGIVAAAVTRLEDHPFDAGLDGPVGEMFDWLAPEMRGPLKLAFANRGLLAPVLIDQLAAKPNTNATLRTTVAVTQLSGSVQDNVLPQRATAVVNLRLHPRDDIASALQRIERVIDDPRVEVTPLTSTLHSEPSRESTVDGPGFVAIAAALRALRADLVVAPSLMIGGTDSRFYGDLADDVYRFHPFWAGPGDTARIHGTDERISLTNLGVYLRFYDTLLRDL